MAARIGIAKKIPQILILVSELVEEPPPVVWLAKTATSFQLAKPPHDEVLWVEGRRLSGAAFSQIAVPQDSNGRWIEAEEVEPPAIRPIALYLIKEGGMSVVQ